jgi:hypothetical protein
MLVWNDLESDEKIKIYDKGVSAPVDSVIMHSASYIAPAISGYRNWNRSRLSLAKLSTLSIAS